MSLLSIGLFLAAAGIVVWIYRTREAPVRGRALLASLRVVVLAILALLLVNPALPGDPADSRDDVWILLDGSLSMGAAGRGGWERARERARRLADSLGGRDGARILLFGATASPVPVDSLAAARPEAPDTRLAPALERAAEGGATGIRVLSDLRVGDPVAVEALLEEIPGPVRLEGTGAPIRNAAVAGVEAPSGVAAGVRPDVTVRIRGEGGGEADSVTVEIREEDRLVASRRAVLPERGREVGLSLRLPPPRAAGGEEARYAARVVLDGDDFAPDDERVALVTVDPPEGGALFLSLRPDWEPRFLLPVLRQVTGLEMAGYLRVGEDRWIPLAPDAAAEGGRTLESSEVRRAVSRSRLLVLHGVGADAPGWLVEAARGTARVLLLPEGPAGAAALGVATGRPLGGEWEPVAELPPSPMAAELSGLDLRGLPPLGGVLPLGREQEGTVPLRVALGGRGPEEAALVLGREGRRRWAVTLASGFWRWAFREGPPREAYRRLWSGVASWLLADEEVASGPGLRPVPRVVARGRPVSWAAPGWAGREIRLEVRPYETDGEGAVRDTTLRVPPDGRFETPAPPPGSYRYRATAVDGGDAVGSGRLEVEAFSGELLLPTLDTARLAPLAAASDGTGTGGARGGRPLRTHPVPWLVVLALLSAEWIGRRRQGLR